MCTCPEEAMAGTNRLDREKFANTVLYLVKRCPDAPGLTKLVKLLYFADFGHYRKHLRSITGAQYVALPRGPVPNDYEKLFADLDGDVIRRREVPIYGLSQPKIEIQAIKEPNEAAFTETEIEALDEVLARHGHESGNTLSHRAHADGPWSIAWDAEQQGKPVPYVLARWLENQCVDETELSIAMGALARDDVKEALSALGATEEEERASV